jgi:hypothetical protein
MADLALQAAGILAIFVALVHGAIGEWQIFPRLCIEPQRTRGLLRMIWQASTVDWIAIGLLLIATPGFESEVARQAVITAAVGVYGFAAIGNAIATRGRHVGWVLMLGVIALALIGI